MYIKVSEPVTDFEDQCTNLLLNLNVDKEMRFTERFEAVTDFHDVHIN